MKIGLTEAGALRFPAQTGRDLLALFILDTMKLVQSKPYQFV